MNFARKSHRLLVITFTHDDDVFFFLTGHFVIGKVPARVDAAGSRPEMTAKAIKLAVAVVLEGEGER